MTLRIAKGTAILIGLMAAVLALSKLRQWLATLTGSPCSWLIPAYSYLGGLVFGLWAALMWPTRLGAPLASLSMFALPLLLWGLLSRLVGPIGALANAIMEPLLLGALASVALIVRILRFREDRLASRRYLLSVVAVSLVAIGFVLWFPDLPE
jgi:hypothetical protein